VSIDELLAEGSGHLDAGRWEAALNAFAGALELGESADACFGLSEALWWRGSFKRAIDLREQAYGLYCRRSEPAIAAEVAIKLAVDYVACLGNQAASEGWLARARRLVDENGIEPLRGWVLLVQASTSATPLQAEQRARAALECTRRAVDPDLELCALSEIGAALIRQGNIAEGVPYLDEAMAGSLGGEGAEPDTVVFTSCNMILACSECAEFDRVVKWVDAAHRFMERYGCLFLRNVCRAAYGKTLVATGDWERAQVEITAAIDSSRGCAIQVLALSALAELRLAQGRFDEAESLLEGFEDVGVAMPILAAAQMDRGDATVAAASLRRLLPSLTDHPLDMAIAAELLGHAEVALGEIDSARARGRELSDLGAALGNAAVCARGRRLWGCALAAVGRAEEARAQLDLAVVGFAGLGMPQETARARLELAGALAGIEPQTARAEAQLARSAFENLGARRDADRANALLRRLGAKPARRGARGESAALTKREHEVLLLLGEGLSNPDIASRLFISRKTVEHHVAKVLAKLGLRNRAQAAAEATRRAAESAPE
jgi:DNA-binding NarL/FixJ family response regulator